jgi:hypothetical protein
MAKVCISPAFRFFFVRMPATSGVWAIGRLYVGSVGALLRPVRAMYD